MFQDTSLQYDASEIVGPSARLLRRVRVVCHDVAAPLSGAGQRENARSIGVEVKMSLRVATILSFSMCERSYALPHTRQVLEGAGGAEERSPRGGRCVSSGRYRPAQDSRGEDRGRVLVSIEGGDGV